MSLENVRAFYEKLANNEAFRAQIQSTKNKAECSQIVRKAGYDFTQQEYEEFTTQLLLGATDSDLREIDKKELKAVVGGVSSITEMQGPIVAPPYGLTPPDIF